MESLNKISLHCSQAKIHFIHFLPYFPHPHEWKIKNQNPKITDYKLQINYLDVC